MNEATRIVRNAAVMPGFNTTTSVDVVNEILDRFGDSTFCNGELRKLVFSKITDKYYSFHTIPFDS